MRLPPGLEPVEGAGAGALAGAWGFSAPALRDWVVEALSAGCRLREVAAADPRARELRGRGPVHVVGGWVVRPYRRGGSVAGPLLGDRYLRLGRHRPLAEALASAETRSRGVPTPAVLAGAVYPSGPFYRADLVTEYIPGSRDLASALFGEEDPDGPPRLLALRQAGCLVALAARSGVEHPDLNAKNILLAREGGRMSAMLLDLDRCQLAAPGWSVAPESMLRRLERSLRKHAAAAGTELAHGDRAELFEAAGASP